MADPKANIAMNALEEVTASLVGTTTLLAPGKVPANASFVSIDSHLLALDPDGAARVVNLPPTTGLRGLRLTVVNTADGAENINLVDEGNSASLVTISQNETGVVVAGDSAWYLQGLGKAT